MVGFVRICSDCPAMEICIERAKCTKQDIDEMNDGNDYDEQYFEDTDLSDDEGGYMEEDGLIDLFKLLDR